MKNSLRAESSVNRSFFVAVPALLWQVLFLYIPLFFILVMSVLKRLDFSVLENITLEHYAAFFNITYYKILFRSVVLAFVTSITCFLIAFPIAYLISFRVRHLKNFLLFFLVLPFWANFLVQVYAWFSILGYDGFLNTLLFNIGIISQPLHILNTPFAIYLVMLFCFLPFMVLPIYSSMEKINHAVLEASYDLGATSWQTIWRVVLPLSSSGIKTAFLLVFIPSFGEFIVPLLLGGGKQLFAGSLISYFFLETRNLFSGAAFTCLSIMVLLVSTMLLYVLLKKIFGRDRV